MIMIIIMKKDDDDDDDDDVVVDVNDVCNSMLEMLENSGPLTIP